MGALTRLKNRWKLKIKEKYPESMKIFKIYKLKNDTYFSTHKFQSLLFLNRLISNERKGKDLKLVPFPKNSFNSYTDSTSDNILHNINSDQTPQKLADELCKYDIVSFDIFDTLILRPLNKPTDLFLLLEKDLNISNFSELRSQAELISRINNKQSNGEINIYDIYDQLSKMCPVSRDDSCKEINLEQKICYANPYMFEVFNILKQKNKKIIAISDMYLPKDVISYILESNGFIGFDSIYISNEYKCNKQNGKLFKIVKKIYKKQKIVHVGDNYSADVLGAKKAKITAIHYSANKL